ncbi:MAG: hypothetical protein MUE44_12630 [Oscillatoriaceae cyanobacterium Prado104]|jgi:hypothetical protein|nr:hypothetical protein [Oscillatoriaceae cyanobacterium Prado104]
MPLCDRILVAVRIGFVKFVINALEIKIQKAEFLVALDTLSRTPVTKAELLSSNRYSRSLQEERTIDRVLSNN